jgi:hypothetical protein
MTNLQLLLTIGIPSLLVVLSWMSNNARFAANEKRVDALEQKMDRKFDEVERRFQDVITAQHRDALEILRSMTALHERVAVVETKQATAA